MTEREYPKVLLLTDKALIEARLLYFKQFKAHDGNLATDAQFGIIDHRGLMHTFWIDDLNVKGILVNYDVRN